MPTIPFVPAFLRRRPTAPRPLTPLEVTPWPANPRTYDDDLKQALKNEAVLAAQLVKARHRLDHSESERLLREAEKELQETSTELMTARAERDEARAEAARLRDDLEAMRLQRNAVQRQLDNALGYDTAALAAIESGTGQPRKGATA